MEKYIRKKGYEEAIISFKKEIEINNKYMMMNVQDKNESKLRFRLNLVKGKITWLHHTITEDAIIISLK
jgi:hypothetical protein